jgi:hypothetical protein
MYTPDARPPGTVASAGLAHQRGDTKTTHIWVYRCPVLAETKGLCTQGFGERREVRYNYFISRAYAFRGAAPTIAS